MNLERSAIQRRWRTFVTAIFLFFFSTASWTAVPECPDQIRIAYADTELPPYVLGTGIYFRDPPGLFVAWARAAMKRIGCQQAVHELRLPYNRIVANMTEGTVDIRVTGGYRPDVADVMRFPMRDKIPNAALAVAEADTKLYVAKGSATVKWDGKSLDFNGSNSTIGTVRGHFSERALHARQWKVESAPTWEANVKKLFAGRVAAIAGTDSVVDALPERKLLEALDPPVQYDLFFAPVSNQFYEKYPAFTHRFWLEICRESRGTFKKLPACSVK